MSSPTVVFRARLGRVTGDPGLPRWAGGLLGLAAMVEVAALHPEPGTDLSVALLLALLATAPIALAPGQTLVAAVMITAATVLSLAGGYRLTVAGAVAQVAVLWLAGRRCRRWVAAALVAPFLGYAITPRGGLPAVLCLVGATAAVTLGVAQRARGERLARDASTRAAADSMLEHVARGERARIARELHDVVAHHISMIAVQAETARLTTAGMPAEGAKRLLAIGDTARSALTEMRRLLGVLRDDAGAEPTRRPQPGLDQLNDLIDTARESSGASTRLIVRGRVVPLDPGLGLTAYRIVQEALTNARRHAAGAAVDVELDYREDSLWLRVRDNGPGPAGGPDGHGLLGMRERVATVGGTLHAGASPAGFEVEAVLPW